MTSIPYYNPIYGTPTPEHWEKVLLSQKEVEQLSERDVKCPICGLKIATVYSRVGYIGNVLLAETPIGHGQTAEQTEANAPIAPTVLY